VASGRTDAFVGRRIGASYTAEIPRRSLRRPQPASRRQWSVRKYGWGTHPILLPCIQKECYYWLGLVKPSSNFDWGPAQPIPKISDHTIGCWLQVGEAGLENL
jgi:hypothetical protein